MLYIENDEASILILVLFTTILKYCEEKNTKYLMSQFILRIYIYLDYVAVECFDRGGVMLTELLVRLLNM